MFALGLRYLNGWAMAAADGASKESAEWPPHPDRIFMALAAAWFETDQPDDEGEALRWLESLPPPGISASNAEYRLTRSTGKPVTAYVPVNDTDRGTKIPDSHALDKLKKAGLALLPKYRSRQPRAFPVAIPHEPDVYLKWEAGLSASHRASLASLCRKVVSVGHSASLVQMWLEDNPPPARLTPVLGFAQQRLRIFGPGSLENLERRHNRAEILAWSELNQHIEASTQTKAKKTLRAQMASRFPNGRPVSQRPMPGLWQGYGRPGTPEPASIPVTCFDPRLVVLTLEGPRLSLTSTLKLTAALRAALLSGCPEPIPEWVSGHAPGGKPTARPHIAFIPLPFVDHHHADGRLSGLALALPHERELDLAEAAAILEPWLRDQHGLPTPIRLFDGRLLDHRVSLETRETPPASLRDELWTRPARRWASVTPVVLDRHYDGKDKWERAADGVKDACERIGLPKPLEVLLHPVSLIEGSPRANEFPHLTRKSDGGEMHHVHALLIFGQPVRGPVIIGAGRFRGYGLCRPLQQGGAGHA